MWRLSNVIMVPLMPRAAAGYNDLEHAPRELQARDVTSVEIIDGDAEHSFVSVTHETQIISGAHR